MKIRLIAMVMTLMTGPVMAGQCGYDYCWGAVGIGPGGAWGFSHSYISEQGAINAVQGECGGDCNNIRTFYNTCGAMAEGNSGNWGFGWGATQGIAESNALNFCYQNGPGCTVKVWSCSP